MPDSVRLTVNGSKVTVSRGTTVAAAVMISGAPCRRSVYKEPRGPLCGMGICFECRVTINGIPHCRSCQIACQDGMEVTTDE
jgi:sarcosine oxidase subunit alpha